MVELIWIRPMVNLPEPDIVWVITTPPGPQVKKLIGVGQSELLQIIIVLNSEDFFPKSPTTLWLYGSTVSPRQSFCIALLVFSFCSSLTLFLATLFFSSPFSLLSVTLCYLRPLIQTNSLKRKGILTVKHWTRWMMSALILLHSPSSKVTDESWLTSERPSLLKCREISGLTPLKSVVVAVNSSPSARRLTEQLRLCLCFKTHEHVNCNSKTEA